MKTALLFLIAIASSNFAFATERGARFQNLDRMIEDLNLRPYFSEGEAPRKHLKIAIFDNGFAGASKEIGNSLPRNTKIHRGPVAQQGEEETHGFYMARILWSMLSLGGTDNRYAPVEFHLYNTFGYTNLKAAVDDAVRNKIDIVLYSQTWEYGGNFDGRGFINKLIDKAIDSGILWVNNSGNVGGTTYNSRIQTGEDDWVQLPDHNQSVEVRCEKNPAKECILRAVLSWNDFSDDVEKGSDKDLDFVLADDTLNVIQSSSLIQTKENVERPGTSKYPREIITAKVKPGLYLLRVKNRSKNFSGSDRLRIVVNGDSLSMARNDQNESLLPPADNARAITVGAIDSERTSISSQLRKPELWTNSLVSLSKEENFKGTSNSAAMVAAGAAVLLSREPGLSREDIIARAQGGLPNQGGTPGQGLPLQMLGFQPTGPNGCFMPVVRYNLPIHVSRMMALNGTLVETTQGLKIMYDYDPIRLGQFQRRLANDIIVTTARGLGLYQRTPNWNLPVDFMELVQTPAGTSICGAQGGSSEPGTQIPSWGKVFRLPSIQ
ncbi:MAG: S8 family serine peptidase [Bdellovibrionota bacterium]